MTHPTLEVLSSFLDEELGADERVQIELHMESCVECRTRLDRLHRVVQTLRRLETAAPPPQLGHSVRRAVVAKSDRQHLRLRLETAVSRWMVPATTLSTFAVIAAMAIIVYLLAWGAGQMGSMRQAVDRQVPELASPQQGSRPQIESELLEVEKGSSAEYGSSPLRRDIAGLSFIWRGDVWEQEGLDGAAVDRIIDVGSQTGGDWLRSHPDLAQLAQLGGVVRVRVETEILELRFPRALLGQ